MKKVLSVALAFFFVFLCIPSMAEEANWYSFTDNIFTVNLPVDTDADQKWTFSISEPDFLDMLCFETVAKTETKDAYFAASFTCRALEAGASVLSLYRNTWDDMIVEVKRVAFVNDETGVMTIENIYESTAEENFGIYLNPYGYDLYNITDLYQPDTSEVYCVQGTFGEMAPEMTDLGVELIGFDEERCLSVVLAEDCRFFVPENLNDLDNIVEVEDFNAWYEAACELLGFRYSFYAKFEMNTDGAFTKLEYFYLP